MNNHQCTQAREATQWHNFWKLYDDGAVIDAQVAHMWQGEPVTTVVVSRHRPKTYCVRLNSRIELRQFFERFDRWSHDLWYWDNAGTYSRIPGSIDHRLMDCLLWGKSRMTLDDWRMVVCRPPMDRKAIARKYRVAIAMKADPPVNEDGKPDRSAGIWWLCRLMLKKGANADEIVAVIEHSKPFVMKRRTHGDRWAKAELKRLTAKLRRLH